MVKSYKGKFSPQNPNKYLGDPTNIIFRSLWERKVMMFLDQNPDIIQWGSEEFSIKYLSPLDHRVHRYFPDFFVKLKNKHGIIEQVVVEIKPYKETLEPVKPKKRVTKRYITEVMTYVKNQAKWEAADAFCDAKGWKFKIFTENDIFAKQ